MLEDLRGVPLFADLADEQLQWVAERSEEVQFQPGDIVFTEGTPAKDFFVLLDGEVQITKRLNGQETVLINHHAGAFTGEIPLLTGTPYVASARVLRPSRILKIGSDTFQHMLTRFPTLAHAILPVLAQRIQTTEAVVMQQEKLAALGKLSAGLAHELNNPAGAARSAAEQLRETFLQVQDLALQLHHSSLNAEYLADLQHEAMARVAIATQLDPLAQSDREDELTSWLESQGVEESWKFAPTFVEAGIDAVWLNAVADRVGTACLGTVLQWLELTLRMLGLINTVQQSATRISTLVKAVKAYSYMDQAPLQEVVVSAGLENTLIILGHKLKNVTVTREYDPNLPRISAYGSELNQVWTNLIDNAIDALDGHGQIWVRTWQENDRIVVEIADNGTGIAPEIQSRIFEPFFTTKGVGEGTGLGLDIVYRVIVRRHNGDIHVLSKPGDTRFQIRLPINLSETKK